MFREMRRFRQLITKEACEKVLENEPRGVLSVHGEDGYPYGLPINFVYDDGKIYFHSANSGHKIDALKKDPRVSFCVYDEGYVTEGKLGLNIRSVIIFGRIRFITDIEEAKEKLRILGLKYHSEDYIKDEVEKQASVVQMLELTIDHMTGKIVNES
ncbi:MAG: pyridoxamine 5'-phosphate oxidase family protein [Anaerovoracaceae bacterium]|jgi:nitroimidazol reductase NimA-like FMN-containing flavoprotein (pyridoxamine 5'-phosphate oxidase superfamily)